MTIENSTPNSSPLGDKEISDPALIQPQLEKWCSIDQDGYIGDRYKISNYGRIKDTSTDSIVKPDIEKDGYVEITLYNHEEAYLYCGRIDTLYNRTK